MKKIMDFLRSENEKYFAQLSNIYTLRLLTKN